MRPQAQGSMGLELNALAPDTQQSAGPAHRKLDSDAQMKRNWQRHRQARNARIEVGAKLAKGKIVEAHNASKLLEAVIRPGDRVCLEGDNQKQADLLSAALLAPAKVNDLHMVQSGIVLAEHLDLFDRGVAKKLDFAYSGPQSARIASMLFGGKIEFGAVHTYLSCLRATLSTSPRTSRSSLRSARTAMATSTPGRTQRTRRPSRRPRLSRTASLSLR